MHAPGCAHKAQGKTERRGDEEKIEKILKKEKGNQRKGKRGKRRGREGGGRKGREYATYSFSDDVSLFL